MASYLKDAQTTHAGVAVANWAGEFECCVCKRKRLTAAEFSKKMQEKRRIDEKASVKCKRCVEAEAEAERDAAAAKAKPAGAATQDAYVCAACEKKLPASEFTKNQIVKGPTKQRCSPCVAKASTEDADASAAKQADALKQAREAFKRAEAVRRLDARGGRGPGRPARRAGRLDGRLRLGRLRRGEARRRVEAQRVGGRARHGAEARLPRQARPRKRRRR